MLNIEQLMICCICFVLFLKLLFLHKYLVSFDIFCPFFLQEVIGVFKPKSEEPYGHLNPKWTKYFHKVCCSTFDISLWRNQIKSHVFLKVFFTLLLYFICLICVLKTHSDILSVQVLEIKKQSVIKTVNTEVIPRTSTRFRFSLSFSSEHTSLLWTEPSMRKC